MPAKGSSSTASAAAAMLSLPRTPGGNEGELGVVQDVVRSRIVKVGSQLPADSGDPIFSVSSGSKLASSFSAQASSTMNPVGTVAAGVPGRKSIAPKTHQAQATLLEWMQNADNIATAKKEDTRGGDNREGQRLKEQKRKMSIQDEDGLYVEVPEEQRQGYVGNPLLEKRLVDPRVKAQHENQRRYLITLARAEEMDYQAERRRAAEERRKLNVWREDVRDALVDKTGSAREAFALLDKSKSGKVSSTEFEGGISSIGVSWQEITDLTKIFSLFQLFDWDKKGYITFANMFPLDAKDSAPERMSTPEFWRYWCKQNKDVTASASAASARSARWEPGGPDEKLDMISKGIKARETVDVKKKWMKGMIHRLKHRGKSDARCREICALHLPKGTGPRDLEEVQTFSQAEVSACRKVYTDKVQESVRKCEKTIFEMHDQRKKLHNSKQQLWTLIEEPILKQRAMDDAKQSLMTGLGGLGGSGGMFKKEHHDEAE